MKGKRMKNEETMEERWKKQWKQWNNGNKWRNNENNERFYFTFFGSKITEDGDCSHGINRYLLLGRKVMTSLLLLLLSRLSCVWLSATPETAVHQAPLSLGFSRQEHWSGLPFPSPMHESEKWKVKLKSLSCVQLLATPWTEEPGRPWDFPGKSTGVGCHCQPRQHIKKQRHCFTNKCPSGQSYGFSSSHVWMWELDYKESWVLKNWCFWTVVLEKTLESPLDCKEIQPVHSKGAQSWVFFGRTDAKAETPVLWPPHAKSWLIGKDSDAGRDWRQEEKGTTEDEMAGWHHRLDGHEFGWTLGDGDGQGGLACCNSWGRKESDTTEWLNWTELNIY